MASATINTGPVFPTGTTVSAYTNTIDPGTGGTDIPIGPATATGTVDAGGFVTLTGLADATTYTLIGLVAGITRNQSFTTPPAAGGTVGGITDVPGLQAALNAKADSSALTSGLAAKAAILDTISPSIVKVYSHSFGTGVYLADPGDRTGARLADELGAAQEINNSINGAALAYPDSGPAPGGISWIAQREKRYRRLAPWSAAFDVGVLIYGINDMPRLCQTTFNGANPLPQGLAVFQNGYRTALALMRSSARFYAANKTTGLDTNITLGTAGNWTNVANGTTPVAKAGSGAVTGSTGYITTTTNGSGGAVTLTIPSDYPGSAVCPLYVMMVADPTLTAGTLTASGAAITTFDLIQTTNGVPGTSDVQNSQKNLIVWRFTGSSIAASTVAQTLTITPSSLAGGTWGLAEFGIESDKPPLISCQGISYGNPGTSALFSNVRNSDIDAWNTGIQSVISEFDANAFYVETNTVLGGTGLSAANSTLNGAITASSPANGGVLTVTNATPFGSSGTVLVYPGTISGEYIGYTGKSGNTLTGITRGLYGSPPFTHADLEKVYQVNAAAIQNFYVDTLHPSERGHALIMKQHADALKPKLTTATQPLRSGRGRADIRCKATSARETLFLANTVIAYPVWFDTVTVDTAFIHDLSTAATQAKFVIPADGVYEMSAYACFSSGKRMSTGQTAAAGVRTLCFGKNLNGTLINNGNMIAPSTTYPTTTDQAMAAMLSTYHVDEFRAGDVIQVFAQASAASGVGSSTNLSAAVTTTGQTAWTVASGTNIANNDYLRVDDEIVQVTAGGTTTSLTVTRGVLGSAAATHLSAAAIFSGVAVVASPPPSFSLKRIGAI